MADDWIIHAGQVAGAVTAILMLLGLVIKWAIIKPIKSYIDQATYPIQPTANGGYSLPDVVKAVHELRGMIQGHLDNHH